MDPRPWTARDGTVLTLRPVHPGDRAIAREALGRLSPRTRYLRFFLRSWKPSEERLARALDPDPAHEFAILATAPGRARETAVAAASLFVDARGDEAEFGLLVADDWQRKGIGEELLRVLVAEAKRRRVKRLHGEILAANAPMLKLARRLGFAIETHAGDRRVRTASLRFDARAQPA